MKKIETEYDKYGWKLIVTESKNKITYIYLRSKGGYHKLHKPFCLRLDKENMKKLMKILIKMKSIHAQQ